MEHFVPLTVVSFRCCQNPLSFFFLCFYVNLVIFVCVTAEVKVQTRLVWRIFVVFLAFLVMLSRCVYP